MPIVYQRHDLFPDDTNPLPTPGSVEQQRLLADEIEVGTETYVESLQKLADVAADMYRELVEGTMNVLTEAKTTRPLRVMNLASGVGAGSLFLIEREIEVSRLVLVDLSDVLLGRARVLHDKSPHRGKIAALETVQLDPLVDNLDRFAPESFDLVVTVNAFAHYPRARQRELFAHVHRLLAPNGVFMFSSQLKPLRPNWKQSLIDDIRNSLRKHGAPADKVENAGNHVAWYHNHLNGADVYNWMEAAGFGFFDCVFRRYIVGIFAAVK